MKFNRNMSPDEGIKWAAGKIAGEKYQTPETFPYPKSKRWDMVLRMNEITERGEWCDKGMFAFVSKEWVKPLADWIGPRKVLEVMAGPGYLAKALREFGISVISTDDYSWIRKMKWEVVTEVVELDAVKSIVKYGKDIDIVIMSWPYMDSTAFKVIRAIHTVNPKALLVYIGEGEGGCTANDNFFEHFQEIDDDEFQKAASQYRSWEAIHDYLTHGRYK